MRCQLATLGALHQQLRVVRRRSYMVRFDVHRRCQFFLDCAFHFALRAAPANFVASFQVLGCHGFTFGCELGNEWLNAMQRLCGHARGEFKILRA